MMAFKRVLEAKRAFKMHSSHMSPETRNNLEVKFTELGVFKLREQTAQVRNLSTHSLILSDLFLIYDGTDREYASFGEFPHLIAKYGPGA